MTFTGSVYDKTTGLQYMNARFYQPATGRFLSQDSYTGNPYDPWTQHLYTYCGNNPTNMVDPTGHEAEGFWNNFGNGAADYFRNLFDGIVQSITQPTPLNFDGFISAFPVFSSSYQASKIQYNASKALYEGDYDRFDYYVGQSLTDAGFKLATLLIGKIAGTVERSVATRAGNAATKAGSTLTSFDDVAAFIQRNGRLPSNFITKTQAKALGWVSRKGNLAEVAPGKSIGGDIFKDIEGKLPSAPGRVWYEADINYTAGFRSGDRIIYSSDGLIFKTTDHYNTFKQIK